MKWKEKELAPAGKFFYKIMMMFQISKLRKSLTKTQKESIQQVDLIRKMVAHAKANGWTEIVSIWSTIGYLGMLSLDLRTYFKIMINQKYGFDRVAILRVIILNMFEGLNDVHDLIGGNFSKALVDLNVLPETLAELKSCKKAFTEFKEKYYTDLKEYRDTAVAHRDFDFLKYTEMIIDTEESSIIGMVLEFENHQRKLATVLTKIMHQTSENFKKRHDEHSVRIPVT